MSVQINTIGAAAIDGSALGGGYELGLACSSRLATMSSMDVSAA